MVLQYPKTYETKNKSDDTKETEKSSYNLEESVVCIREKDGDGKSVYPDDHHKEQGSVRKDEKFDVLTNYDLTCAEDVKRLGKCVESQGDSILDTQSLGTSRKAHSERCTIKRSCQAVASLATLGNDTIDTIFYGSENVQEVGSTKNANFICEETAQNYEVTGDTLKNIMKISWNVKHILSSGKNPCTNLTPTDNNQKVTYMANKEHKATNKATYTKRCLPDDDEKIISEATLPEAEEKITSKTILPEAEEKITSKTILPEAEEKTILPEAEEKITSKTIIPEIEERITSDTIIPEVEEKVSSETILQTADKKGTSKTTLGHKTVGQVKDNRSENVIKNEDYLAPKDRNFQGQTRLFQAISFLWFLTPFYKVLQLLPSLALTNCKILFLRVHILGIFILMLPTAGSPINASAESTSCTIQIKGREIHASIHLRDIFVNRVELTNDAMDTYKCSYDESQNMWIKSHHNVQCQASDSTITLMIKLNKEPVGHWTLFASDGLEGSREDQCSRTYTSVISESASKSTALNKEGTSAMSNTREEVSTVYSSTNITQNNNGSGGLGPGLTAVIVMAVLSAVIVAIAVIILKRKQMLCFKGEHGSR